MTVDADDFEFVRRLVLERSALSLPDGKEYLVASRLAPVAEREGLGSVAALVRKARDGSAALRTEVVEAMATNETSFFRDAHPFEALRSTVLPQVLAGNGGRSVALWSAAASTGQEAYSLAMLVRDDFPQVRDVTILATDFAHDVLERTRSGCYTQLEVNRGLPAALLVKYFDRDGRHWTVKPAIRELVTVREVNLAKPLPALAAMDVVFLRNVLIYLDPAMRTTVLRRVATVLRPGGYLFLGAAETVHGLDDLYERVPLGRSVCYRTAGPQKEKA